MIKKLVLVLLIFSVVAFFSSCGGKDTDKEEGQPGTEVQKEQSSQPEAEAESKGNIVAKEILNTYDQLVAEVLELVKDKPEAADLKPKLEELYANYTEKMKELNVKYLALRDEDIALFGDCNGYLGENRGKHVFEKDKVLDEYIAYYDYTKGEKEIVEMLKQGIFDILETAVAR